jgi:15-cis-phytoene synthase
VLLLRRDDVLDEARMTTNRVARTFAVACRLLPRESRDDVYRLYLVFRTLDDLVDEGDPGVAAAHLTVVEAWCHGSPARSGEARVLEDLATRHPLPRDAFLDFCAGMRDDLAGRRFETEDDLDEYCYRVAGTVGVVMMALLGHDGDTPRVRRAAAALGMAMQRTNILRDIDEDGHNGRVYLAAETVARFGAPRPGCRKTLLRDQIARADALYDEGIAGITSLRSGRRAIRAAASMYREILRQIERDGYGEHPGRAVVPTRRKLLVAARATV